MATPQLRNSAITRHPAPADDHAAGEALLLRDLEASITLPSDAHGADDTNNAAGISFSWSWLPTLLGFLFLSFNSATAIVRSHGDASAVAFVGFAYADLLALFACLRMYELAPAGSNARSWLKVAVWVLTTLLTLAFSGKVAAVMPPPVAVMVWLMAFATVAGGFVAFFVCKEKNVSDLARKQVYGVGCHGHGGSDDHERLADSAVLVQRWGDEWRPDIFVAAKGAGFGMEGASSSQQAAENGLQEQGKL